MSWIQALEQEIANKKNELMEVQAAIAKGKDLLDEVNKLEMILATALGKKSVKAVGKKGGRKPFTEEQKAAASLRQKAAWAARKASPKGSAAPSRAKSS